MQPYIRMALKEWALVVWALEQGRQILLLRKGGLAEEEGEFRLLSREFFLYPTYEHQQTGWLQPQFLETFHTLAQGDGSNQQLILGCYALVTDVLSAPELVRMQLLRDAFVWNDSFLEKRYTYKPELPLYVLLVRAFRLPQPIRILRREQYVGCRSWVELEENLPTEGAVPVLEDGEFEQRREALRQRLA